MAHRTLPLQAQSGFVAAYFKPIYTPPIYNTALFAGGKYSTNFTGFVYIRNEAGNGGTGTALYVGRMFGSSAPATDNALFGGGLPAAGNPVNNLDSRSSTGANIASTTLSTARQQSAAATADGIALFFGGYNSSIVTSMSLYVDLANDAAVRSSATNLPSPHVYAAAASAGPNAIIIGGNATAGGALNNSSMAYTSQGIAITGTALASVGSNQGQATAVEGKAIYGGGYVYTDVYNGVINIFDENSIASTGASVTGRVKYAAATAQDRAIFFGGNSVKGGVMTLLSTVDVVTSDGIVSVGTALGTAAYFETSGGATAASAGKNAIASASVVSSSSGNGIINVRDRTGAGSTGTVVNQLFIGQMASSAGKI